MDEAFGLRAELNDALDKLARIAACLDTQAVAEQDVDAILDDLARAARLVDGMTTLLAHRLTDTAANPTARLAAQLGTSQRAASQRLEASRALCENDAVRDAVRAGALSREQTEAVALAVQANPSATTDLLDAAASQALHDLRRTARDAVQAADADRDATRRRHWRNRSFRSRQELDGEWVATLSAPADVGARIEAAIRPAHDRRFRAAHAAGEREPDAAYRLDALVEVLVHGTTHGQPAGATHSTGRQAKVIAVVDAAALRRGTREQGETCRIHGVGEVALSAVQQLLPDAHLAYLFRHGTTDLSVAHLGRQVTAAQRTALEARGYECEVPGCRSQYLLEIDHVLPWARTHRTAVAHLAWLCAPHHAAKSIRGYRLTGPPGRRRWRAPDGSFLAGSTNPPQRPPEEDPQLDTHARDGGVTGPHEPALPPG